MAAGEARDAHAGERHGSVDQETGERSVEHCTRRHVEQIMIYMVYIVTCRTEMLCRICVAQIQPRKDVLDHIGYTVPFRKHEVDHTDHTDHTDIQIIPIRNTCVLKV